MMPGALVATLLGDQVKTALTPAGGFNYWLIGGVAALVIGVVNRISQARAQAVLRRAACRQCAYAGLGASRTARPGRARYGDLVKRTATLPRTAQGAAFLHDP